MYWLVACAPLLIAANVNTLVPPINSTGLLQTESATTLAPRQWALSGQLSYAYNPVIWRYSDNTFAPVVANQGLLDLTFNIGITQVFDVAIGLPAVWQGGGTTGPTGDAGGVAIGDTRLSARFAPVPTRIFGFGAAGVLEITVPTGNPKLFMGDGGVDIHPKLVASVPIGGIMFMGNIGYMWRLPNSTLADVAWGDLVDWHIGGRKTFTLFKHLWGFSLELGGRGPVRQPLAAGATGLEALAGITSRWADAWDVTVGVGKGMGAAVGVPVFQVLTAVAYRPSAQDSDNDGIPDSADACPNAAEDYNGYADLDGCPDAHEAPVPPPPPVAPAPPPPTEEAPPPAPDRDHDGIPDEQDSCPDVAEDRDGVLDQDGCPDADNDHDGVPDQQDMCPDLPETINGLDDGDGCPDEGQGATVFKPGEGIEIKVAVQFETNRAVIKQASFPLLDEVALQLLAHTEVTLVRVEGHTDSVGAAAGNLRLSQARAEAVRAYLVERGVGGERMEAVGYGETKPIDTNDTPEGRANNRRVTFVILQTSLFP